MSGTVPHWFIDPVMWCRYFLWAQGVKPSPIPSIRLIGKCYRKWYCVFMLWRRGPGERVTTLNLPKDNWKKKVSIHFFAVLLLWWERQRGWRSWAWWCAFKETCRDFYAIVRGVVASLYFAWSPACFGSVTQKVWKPENWYVSQTSLIFRIMSAMAKPTSFIIGLLWSYWV